MKLSYEEIRQILSIVEASSFDTIEIKTGNISLSASKSGAVRLPPVPDAATASPQQPRTAPVAAVAALAEKPAVQSPPAPGADGNDGLIEIVAPIVGTFYVAPEPGAAPFVTEGDTIDEDTTIGIIEVMKVFSSIPAEKKGTVVRCLVGNGEFVEFGQPLLLVRPER